jgi:hypothetical protein
MIVVFHRLVGFPGLVSSLYTRVDLKCNVVADLRRDTVGMVDILSVSANPSPNTIV